MGKEKKVFGSEKKQHRRHSLREHTKNTHTHTHTHTTNRDTHTHTRRDKEEIESLRGTRTGKSTQSRYVSDGDVRVCHVTHLD
jgi:hypothetical protein